MKRTIKTTIAIIIFCSAFAIYSCSKRLSDPLKGTFISANNTIARGEQLYDIHCDKCHPGGEGGLGPDVNWNPAPNFIKRFQVRHGLGVMPSFKKDEISKDDLHAISKYMKAIKHQKRV